jgi:hypothetical protein
MSLSHDIQRMLELQSRQPFFGEGGLSDAYMRSLNHLWSGRFSAAADAAASAISDSPDDLNTPRLYRVWIEALASMEDKSSLAALGEHLMHLGMEHLELRQTYMALRGIIHCELDQAPAIRLVLRSVGHRVNNPYCLEFETLCARRGFSDSEFCITASTVQITDYFTWMTLIQDLSQLGNSDDLASCMRHIQHSFPGAPVTDVVSMQIAFENGHWQAAATAAARLRAHFPDHYDYAFYNAVSLYRSQDSEGALAIIQSLDDSRRSQDPDLTSLEAEIQTERALSSDDEQAANLAAQLLERSIKMYRRCGLEVDHFVSLLRKVETHFGGSSVVGYSQNQFREPHSWLVMLSPRRAEELANAKDHVIEELHRPLGREASPGDIVLFVSRAAHIAKKPASTRNEWRLLAMYRVASRTFWHPTERYNSLLELIDRPEHPVPIDAHEIKSDMSLRGRKSSLPRGHHARYGVFKLDESAMDLMIAAVKRRSDGIDHENERRQVNLSKQKPS